MQTACKIEPPSHRHHIDMHHIVMNRCTLTSPLHNESAQPCLPQCMNLLHHHPGCISPHEHRLHQPQSLSQQRGACGSRPIKTQ